MIRVLENKDCINSFSLKKEKRKLRKKILLWINEEHAWEGEGEREKLKTNNKKLMLHMFFSVSTILRDWSSYASFSTTSLQANDREGLHTAKEYNVDPII